MHARAVTRFTPEQYLAMEAHSTAKHEYFEGYILAMAGGAGRHALVSANTQAALSVSLGPTRCVALSSDMRVLVEQTGLYTYSDASVACAAARWLGVEAATTLVDPAILCEVLSPSTESYDRGEKLNHYQRIPALGLVLLIDWRTRSVTAVARDDHGWTSTRFSVGESVPIPISGAAPLPVDALFAKLELVPELPGD